MDASESNGAALCFLCGQGSGTTIIEELRKSIGEGRKGAKLQGKLTLLT
jgi:hypothetical protein